MKCPGLDELPPPPEGKTGWPWTEETLPLANDQLSGAFLWPKVTLVTPSFNQGRYLEETIRSVLLQGYPNLEYLIIDGGSTDDTIAIIRRYEKWITAWVSEPDGGQSHAINKGFARSTGELVNWQNADDVLTKGSILTTARALVENPEASVVTGYIVILDENSRVVSVNDGHPDLKGKSGFLHDEVKCFTALKMGCQLGALMRRDLIQKVGGVDESIHYCMDVDLLLRLMVEGPAYHVDYPVVMFRVHGGSKTSALKGGRATERLKVAQKLFKQKNLSPAVRKTRHMAFANAHLSAFHYFYEWRIYGMAFYHFVMRWLHLSIYLLKDR